MAQDTDLDPFMDIYMPAPGQFWKHYKGGLYKVHAIATDDMGFPVVIHHAAEEKTTLFTRRLSEWLQWIDVEPYDLPGQQVSKDGKRVKMQRYEYHDEVL